MTSKLIVLGRVLCRVFNVGLRARVSEPWWQHQTSQQRSTVTSETIIEKKSVLSKW